LLANACLTVVLADARAAELLALASSAAVLAEARATALQAPASNAVVLAETMLALASYARMFTFFLLAGEQKCLSHSHVCAHVFGLRTQKDTTNAVSCTFPCRRRNLCRCRYFCRRVRRGAGTFVGAQFRRTHASKLSPRVCHGHL